MSVEESELLKKLDTREPAAHIAVIMDGNGRWAEAPSPAARCRTSPGRQDRAATVETCARLGLNALTLYAFSVENWKRPREVDFLWNLLERVSASRAAPCSCVMTFGSSLIGAWQRRLYPCSAERDRSIRKHRGQSRPATEPCHQLWRTRRDCRCREVAGGRSPAAATSSSTRQRFRRVSTPPACPIPIF